ncbi:LOW QUALITY PROTEIN: methionine aminopeptidase-like [Sycon ciliatum]|uniref:LOW QUALITY PROTEIN: methionine aminopeptidase-like n=1 Tax=Sycon ciliatum TaxID=27933 RepID=UPI0031F71E3A
MIHLKTDKEIYEMRKAGELTYQLLDLVGQMIKPGVSTLEIDKMVHGEILNSNAFPGTLGYRGFKHSCCTSVNDVICHGIPSDYRLKEGDILNVDISPRLNGWYGDSSRMFTVGEVSDTANKLISTTETALIGAIQCVRVGDNLSEIGKGIEAVIFSISNFSIVEDYVGHGIGRSFHEDPAVFHYNRPTGVKFQKGMVFTIEPMINEGTKEWIMLDDGWTVKTKDGLLSAQMEHTIAINSKGDVEVISLP